MPKVWEALITLVALIALLAVGIIIFGAPVHVPMFCGVCVAALMALYLGYKWDVIEKRQQLTSQSLDVDLMVRNDGWQTHHHHQLSLL